MRILVDTNILLRLVEATSVQQQACRTAINLLQAAGHDFFIVPQNLYEFWSVATRPAAQNGLGMPAADANRTLDELRVYFRLLRDE